MNFEFSAEQEAIRDQIRRVVSDVCPSTVVRDVLEGRADYAQRLWETLADLGMLGVGISEESGGTGLGVLELCVIAEEIGRALAPVPFLSSRALAAEAIRRAPPSEHRTEWLRKLARGQSLACYASDLTSRCAVRMSKSGITGRIGPVLHAPLANAVILAVPSDGERRLLLVPVSQSGVTVERVRTIDPTLVHGDLVFASARFDVLAEGNSAASAQAVAEFLGAVVCAFEQLGGAAACLTMARDYALQRYVFGRVIGSYQAIKHKLADVHVRNTIARGHAYHGAWALESQAPELELAVAGARAAATEAFTFAASENLQTHGGIGFTWELDCHLFYRRARLLSLCLGPAQLWKERIVRALEKKHAA